MDYGIPTLAMFSNTGELTRLPNSRNTGLALFSRGSDASPEWRLIDFSDIKSGFPAEGVMISNGANQPPTSEAGSADKQFLKYSVSNNKGSYEFSDIGIGDITGLQTALDGKASSTHNHDSAYAPYNHNHDSVYAPYSHEHPYLPLAGGVMHSTAYDTDTQGVKRYDYQGVYSKAPISTELIENYGRYLGVAYGTITTLDPSVIVIKTGITSNANLPSSETFFQIHVSGLAMSNKGKTLDVRIGLSIKTNGTLNAGSSGKTGWASFGSIAPSDVKHAIVSNKHIIVIVVPSDTYRINVDAFCDYASVRDSNWVSNINNSIIRGWVLADSSSATLTNLTRIAIPHSKDELPNIESLNSGANVAGKLLVSTASGAEWLPVGTNGNFLKQTASGPAYTGITISDISDLSSALPSAYDTAAEPLGESASPGLSSAYSRGDHIHPLPYAVPSAERLFFPRKIGIIGAITAEAIEFDGTGDVFLNALRIDPYFFETAVPVSSGGTGATTFSSYSLLVGNGTSAIGTISPENSNAKFLRSNGLNSFPSYESITWDNITSKPNTFTPATHTHGLGDIKGTGTASAVMVTNPTNTAGESIGTTSGEVGQVLAQIEAGTTAKVGWITPRMRDVRAFYDISSSSPSAVTHKKGHDTLVYVVDGGNLATGQTSYTCEVSIPSAATNGAAAEGDQIELHLISQATAGVTGKLRVQINSSTSYGNLLFMKDGVIVQASSTNILECGNGQYIVLRAVAMSQSDRNYETYNWLAKVVAEVN